MNESRAARYQRHRRLARAVRLAAAAVALGLIAFTPFAAVLEGAAWDLARTAPSRAAPVVAFLLFTMAALLLVELAALSAGLVALNAGGPVAGLQRDLRLRAPAAADGRSVLVTVAAAVVALGIAQVAIRIAGDWWWLVTALVIAAASCAAMHIAPHGMSAFTNARPIDSQALLARLAHLCRRAGVPMDRVDHVPVPDGDRTSAFVAGVGRRRRVFLASTLVRDWSEDEIAVVVAHELGHLRRGDLWRTLALDAAILLFGLGTAALLRPASPRVGELAALPAIAWIACAVWTASAPLRHAQSRHHERQADAFALALTGAADAFATVVRRLGAHHLADEEPSTLARWLTYRHPPVGERLAVARAFARQTQVKPALKVWPSDNERLIED